MPQCCDDGACGEDEALLSTDDDATLYEILGVVPHVDDAGLKRAYKKQAVKLVLNNLMVLYLSVYPGISLLWRKVMLLLRQL